MLYRETYGIASEKERKAGEKRFLSVPHVDVHKRERIGVREIILLCA